MFRISEPFSGRGAPPAANSHFTARGKHAAILTLPETKGSVPR